MASSAAPDDNNLIVMGVNAEDMSIAANYLIEKGGGQVVVSDGKIIKSGDKELAHKLEKQGYAWLEEAV